ATRFKDPPKYDARPKVVEAYRRTDQKITITPPGRHADVRADLASEGRRGRLLELLLRRLRLFYASPESRRHSDERRLRLLEGRGRQDPRHPLRRRCAGGL